MSPRQLLWILLALLSFSGTAVAREQDPERVRLELRVSASTSRAVFVEVGTQAGLRLGDRVQFFPPGQVRLDGVVRAVTSNHARIELLSESDPLPIGTRGEAMVLKVQIEPGQAPEGAPPTTEPEAGTETAPAREVPEHPPWQTPPEEWEILTPLLSPAAGTSLTSRETSVQGRVWGGARWRSTRLNGRRESGYARTGMDVILTNPFQSGGELRFDGELYGRYADNPGNSRVEEGELRLTQLYYKHGNPRETDRSWILGRFYQETMPEFGPLDGVEITQRLSIEDELGTSIGHMPRPSGEVAANRDYQAAVFHRHRSTSAMPIDYRVGYQKTWHEGSADRDLFVLDSSLRTEEHAFLSATGWIDYYESSETEKDERLELTRLFLSAGKSNVEGDGLRLYYSEFRFPSLKRQEINPDIDDQIFDEHNTRLGLDGWTALDSGPRLRARIDRWADEDDGGEAGYSSELRCDVPRALPGGAELGVSVFGSHGEFSENGGLRLSALGQGLGSFWSLSWELQFIQENAANTPTPREWQNQIYGNYDTQIFESFSLSLDLGLGWGDQGDTLSLGLYLQRSF